MLTGLFAHFPNTKRLRQHNKQERTNAHMLIGPGVVGGTKRQHTRLEFLGSAMFQFVPSLYFKYSDIQKSQMVTWGFSNMNKAVTAFAVVMG